MTALFVYGTLCFPEIVEKLTGKSFQMEPAVLSGFQRKMIKNADYPAIIVNSNSVVEGIVLHDVDELSMKILSFYEGENYRCVELPVKLNEEFIRPKVFIWDSTIDELEFFDWNEDEFSMNSKKVYINKIIPETLLEFNRQSKL
jgi:gamma-glutamylcyclotransferase (GGCT)/AIG2-like uncharacterized protein YtfP